jgi:signal transduction histidine kinase
MTNLRFITRKSIKVQVVSFIVITITLMTLVLSMTTSSGVNKHVRQLMLNNSAQITQGLAKRAIFPLLSWSEQNAQEAMRQVQGFDSVIAARLVSTDGKVLVTIGTFPTSTKTNEPDANSGHIIKESSAYWMLQAPVILSNEELIDTSGENEFLLDDEADFIKTETIGYAEVVYSKKYLLESQNKVTQMIRFIGIASVVIISLILYFGLERLFSPLQKLSTVMKDAKDSGEFLLAETKGAKEIRNMASAFNQMMAVLAQQGDELKNYNTQLEIEVKNRTLELVVARDDALSASKHKSEFIANMSHELRTPIQSIIGYGELVTEELELEANFELIEDMDKISRNSQRLLQMINSLLDLTKVESGKMTLNSVDAEINNVITSIEDTITPLAQKSQNSFVINNRATLTHITTDKEKLEQVLFNLLSNACKFTEKGDVSLTINNSKEYITFAVQDTGIGLSKEQQRYIFDEFTQVDSSQSRKFYGTGLGLAISRRFVELMNGEITVDSQVEQGSTFTVILPINTD